MVPDRIIQLLAAIRSPPLDAETALPTARQGLGTIDVYLLGVIGWSGPTPRSISAEPG